MNRRLVRLRTGSTIVELLISTAITSVLIAGLFVGMVAVQRSYRAARHHAKSQIEQARILDYIARDLRRALTVREDVFEGGNRLLLTIPDFYEPGIVDGEVPQPRDPVIHNGSIQYGNPDQPIQISYYQSGSGVFRSVNGRVTQLASDVEDFELEYDDDGGQIVEVSVSFVPRFQLNARDVGRLRLGTATHSVTLLRNKRQN